MASRTSADAAAKALNCLGVDLDSYAVSDRAEELNFNGYFEERESDEDSNGSGKTILL